MYHSLFIHPLLFRHLGYFVCSGILKETHTVISHLWMLHFTFLKEKNIFFHNHSTIIFHTLQNEQFFNILNYSVYIQICKIVSEMSFMVGMFDSGSKTRFTSCIWLCLLSFSRTAPRLSPSPYLFLSHPVDLLERLCSCPLECFRFWIF